MAASITITRQVNQPYGDYESTLISAFVRNSLEFKVNHDGATDTYAKVFIGEYDFLAVVRQYDYEVNTDLYHFDITDLLPSFLGFGSTPYNRISNLSKDIYIQIVAYNSDGSVLANQYHDTIQIGFILPPISSGADFYDYVYEFGAQKPIYYTNEISFYWKHSAGN